MASESDLKATVEGMKGDLNKWDVAVQVLESKILKGTIKDKAVVQKIRNVTQKQDLKVRQDRIIDIIEKIQELDGAIIKPTRETFNQAIVDKITTIYGDWFTQGFGLGVGLGPQNISRNAYENSEIAVGVMKTLSKAEFKRCAKTLENLGNHSVIKQILT